MNRGETMKRAKALLDKGYSLTKPEQRELQSLTRNLLGRELYELVGNMNAATADYHKARQAKAPTHRKCRPAHKHDAIKKARAEYKSVMEAQEERIDLQELNRRFLRLESLLNDGCAEQELHAFLAENVSVLLPTPIYYHHLAISKPLLAEKYVPDFALYGSCNGPWWTFVEIEKPSDRLFTEGGDYSAALFHAIRQVHDWQIFINSHFHYYLECFGSEMGFDAHPNFLILIGRRSEIDNDAWQKLSLLNSQGRGGTGFFVATFDFLLEFKRRLNAAKSVDYELRRIGFLADRGGTPEFHMKKALSWSQFQEVRRCWRVGSFEF